MGRSKMKVVESYVMTGANYFLCEFCIASGLEPRWSIVMAAASYGLTEEVVDCITNKKYIGETIYAIEVL